MAGQQQQKAVTVSQAITPEQVRQLTKPTDGFLCRFNDNIYAIDFKAFVVKDADTQEVFFQVERPSGEPELPPADQLTPEMEDAIRHVNYTFPRAMLQCKAISTGVVFSVGPVPLPGLRMIERHYFKDRLVREYDMDFGFCIPNSTNSWETQYDMPLFAASQVDEFVRSQLRMLFGFRAQLQPR